MDYQTIYREVRAALDEKQAREAGLDPNAKQPLFVDLEGRVEELMPLLEGGYDSLAPIQRLWTFGGVDAILAQTADDGIPLGQGTLTAAQWKALQRVFHALALWAQTAIVLPTDPEGTPAGPIPLAVISARPTA